MIAHLARWIRPDVLRQRLARRCAVFARDRSGLAATEFALLVPLMLVLFFGTVEVSSGVAVDRKITIAARALSDLISQATTVTDTDFTNTFAAGAIIIAPYDAGPIKAKISQIYVNADKVAKVVWGKAYNDTARAANDVVTTSLPAGLLIPDTYLIWSEVNYRYVPVLGYVMDQVGVTLGEQTFTRPRQSTCVTYKTSTCS